VLGTRATVKAMQRDCMLQYFEKQYSADNTVVAVAGRIDFDDLVAQLEKRCGNWRTTGPTRAHPVFRAHEERVSIAMKQASRAYLACLWPAPPVADPRRYAATMLAQILRDTEGSRLYWALIETGLAEEAQAQYDGHDGIGAMVAYAACAPKDVDRVEGIMAAELERLTNSITAKELENARAKVATAVVTAGERPAGRMRRLGSLWMYRGAYASLEEEMAEIDRLTVQDLQQVAHDYPMRPTLVARVMPEK
jgi:predicted Zn-dependent peptidase